jgi:AcrR family transcriptional regulator
VRGVFATKGFDGTKTRDLADAAGVSEALLFKHFPNKEALFQAVQVSCYDGQYDQELDYLMGLEPSASTLIMMVHVLISYIVRGTLSGDSELATYNRLMLRSLAEDGEFAWHMLQRPAENWIPKCEACLQVAVAEGDAVDGLGFPALRGWFAYQLAAMIRTHLQPERPAVDYGVRPEVLVEQAVRFILRGIGLKDEAIKKHYNPKMKS